jgi:hypothetical protein
LDKFLVCETTYQQHTAEEEFVTCHQLELEKCTKESGCPTVPKTECAVHKRNVTQEFPETEVSCEGLIALKNNLSTIGNYNKIMYLLQWATLNGIKDNGINWFMGSNLSKLLSHI